MNIPVYTMYILLFISLKYTMYILSTCIIYHSNKVCIYMVNTMWYIPSIFLLYNCDITTWLVYAWYIQGIHHVYFRHMQNNAVPIHMVGIYITFLGMFSTFIYNDIHLIYIWYTMHIPLISWRYQRNIIIKKGTEHT